MKSFLFCVAVLCLCFISPAASFVPEPIYNTSSCYQFVHRYLTDTRGPTSKNISRELEHARIDFFEATRCLSHPPSTDEEKKMSRVAYIQLCAERLANTKKRLETAEKVFADHSHLVTDHAPFVVSTCWAAVAATDPSASEPLRVTLFFAEVTRGIVHYLVEAHMPTVLEFQQALDLRAEQLQSLLTEQQDRVEKQSKKKSTAKSSAKKAAANCAAQAQSKRNTTISSGIPLLCESVSLILKEVTPTVVQEYAAMVALLIGLPLVASAMVAFVPLAIAYFVVVEIVGFFVQTVLINGLVRPVLLNLFETATSPLGPLDIIQAFAAAFLVEDNMWVVGTVLGIVGFSLSLFFVLCLPPAILLLEFFQTPVVYREKEDESDDVVAAAALASAKKNN